jgi:hypothetical protein
MEDGQEGKYEPDFVLPNRDAVNEANWSEYQAKGFAVVSASVPDEVDVERYLTLVQGEYGVANVYTGEAFDRESGRPLRHKPGIGIYVSPEGIAHRDAGRAETDDSHMSPDEPASS